MMHDDIKKLLYDLYGLTVSEIKQFVSYYDKNFLIRTRQLEESKEYLLKIHKSNSIVQYEAETKLLEHLRDKNVAAPIPVKTLDSKWFHVLSISDSETYIIRLFIYIPGTILFNCGQYTRNLLKLLGDYVGKIDVALKTFHHSFYDDYIHDWSLLSFKNITHEQLLTIDNLEYRNIVKMIQKQFQTDIVDKKHLFQYGQIHGDINDQNIIINDTNDMIIAIIDYGDSHRSYYIFELAITILYVLLFDENTIEDLSYGTHVLKGYTKYIQFNQDELKVLPICIKARLCQSLINGLRAYKLDPTNTYVMTTQKLGWKFLMKLTMMSNDEIMEQFLHESSLNSTSDTKTLISTKNIC
ncbi:unnamed protein product [Didymodactylos carnosus]|uniref:Hydroxylysine kinase n=1 Tax=Didymodactylos carnosus TaxID=1234261 RepID=A0A814LS29_9BILA|nr:unnamed protein product [Didymodactylos carnosus]CAF3836638.1 unnamed protein product [Didymodactylos carnosus]